MQRRKKHEIYGSGTLMYLYKNHKDENKNDMRHDETLDNLIFFKCQGFGKVLFTLWSFLSVMDIGVKAVW